MTGSSRDLKTPMMFTSDEFGGASKQNHKDRLATTSLDMGIVHFQKDPTSYVHKEDESVKELGNVQNLEYRRLGTEPMDTDTTRCVAANPKPGVASSPTFERMSLCDGSLLYGKQSTDSAATTEPKSSLYGSTENKVEIRRWLNDHRIHESVGDKLHALGVLDLMDLVMLVRECP
eukprot:CAMPEP_0118716414 /NCGR_PEP_ID=MMETSP0800-20121206/27479_1 /TAXON_ID=210618 ORGANISM="Striatella unipunctata, Strain CCMP2910" /NCGR_SAMPLE_ID=MMETSP0800 /ASSEMBLY_ACC=CAM_ASM_000638 /LENGTH=174 /DNA_ID=CAMNT_0006622815 /DNA_START=172 /DNA_END=692 /DNA_ORIENTATION=-